MNNTPFPTTKHLTGLFLLIINWIIIKRFSLHNPITDFLMLFILAGCEYALIALVKKLLSFFSIKINIKSLTGELMLQTVFVINLFAFVLALPMGINKFINPFTLFSSFLIILYPLSYFYNKALKHNHRFKNNVNLVFWCGVAVFLVAIPITRVIDTFTIDGGTRMLMFLAGILAFLKGIPYAYEFIDEEKKSNEVL